MLLPWITMGLIAAISHLFVNATFHTQYLELISWINVLVVSLVFFMTTMVKYKDPMVFTLVSLGYVFRVGLLFWDTYFRHIFNLMHSGADSEMFYRNARNIFLTGVSLDNLTEFYQFVALTFHLFGPSRIMAQYTNLLLAMTAILPLISLADRLKLHPSTKHIMLLLAFFVPNFAFVNVILLREVQVMILLSFSFYGFLWWILDKKLWGLALALILPTIAVDIHRGAFAPLIGYMICLALYDRKTKRLRITPRTIFFGIITILSIPTIDYMLDLNLLYNVETVDDFASDLASPALLSYEQQGGSTFSAEIIQTGNSLADMIINTPIRIVYFALVPMPWYWRGLNDILAFTLSSLPYLGMYTVSFKALRIKGVKPYTGLISISLIIVLASFFIYGWGVSNSGTAMRHRDKFFLHHVLMASLGIEQLYRNRARLLALTKQKEIYGYLKQAIQNI